MAGPAGAGRPDDRGFITADLRLAALLIRRAAARFELGEGDPHEILAATRELCAAMNRFRQAAAWRGGEEVKDA